MQLTSDKAKYINISRAKYYVRIKAKLIEVLHGPVRGVSAVSISMCKPYHFAVCPTQNPALAIEWQMQQKKNLRVVQEK